MEHARPPAELTLEGGPANRADSWRKWLKQFQVFLKASGVCKESADVQASLLINLIGSDGYDVYTTFKFDKEEDRDDITKLIEKFNHHFGTKTNVIMVRFKFFTRSQESGEGIDEYVTALRILSQQCEFDKLEDGLLRDRIVCGIKDSVVRDRLLRTDDLTLEKAIRMCQSSEVTCEESRQIEGVKNECSKSMSVDALRNRDTWRGAARRGGRGGRGVGARALGGGGAGAGGAAAATAARSARERLCASCAESYCDGGDRCAAKNVKCFLCGFRGHFKKVCPGRKSSKVYQLREDSDELYYLDTIQEIDHVEDSKWYETLQLLCLGQVIKHTFKLDTGSDLNVLSKNNFLKLGFQVSDINPVNVKAQSFCGNYVAMLGSFTIKCILKSDQYLLKFVISDNDCQSIIGKDALEQLGLVKRAGLVLSVDASSHALGAVLLQDTRPVEFASATLTDTQKRYAQIEKEMLAIVFALERFHQYVYGKMDVIVETDHKPLEALFQKSLDAVPARLQRMMLRVQRYDFSVVYKPGKYMFVADTLSRAPLADLMGDKVSCEVDEQTCFLLRAVQMSDNKIELIRQHSRNDKVCQVLTNYIKNGWPNSKHESDESVRALWDSRECFEWADGVLFKNNLVYIPADLRLEMVSRVHEGHLGIDRCKRRAREVMYWPGMSRDIERTVRRCRTCAQRAPAPQREPMMPHLIPGLPWAKIGSDIFEHKNKYYLLIVDYFLNFVEVCPIRSINSSCVVLAMKDQFSRHGIPVELISDNGPAFSSREFKKFTELWDFRHSTSSPGYPQSNGRSERAVRTIKMILKKSLDAGADFYLGLLNYRATPRDGIASPAQLLMGRRLNTRLPAHEDKLLPDRDNAADYANILHNQARSKECHDAHARALPELQPGDDVIALDGSSGRRRTARVTGRAPQPRSYLVTDAAGKRYRRNRRHLIKIEPEAVSPTSSHHSHDAACSSGGSVYDDVAESPGTDPNTAGTDTRPQTDQAIVPRPTIDTYQRPPRAAAIKAKKKLQM